MYIVRWCILAVCVYFVLLGFFYFMLANLPPWVRSKIHSVQLVAIVKNYIKTYSMRAVLSPLVDDLKKLVSISQYIYWTFLKLHTRLLLLSDCCCFLQEVGHELVLHQVPKTIYGTFAAVSADNPASSSFGRFKEGSTAYRFCQHCLTTREEIKSKVKKMS